MVSHRDKLLDAAQSLMLSKGFPSTGVEEICSTAGVTKGSFYHHFSSKERLASVLIDRYFETVTEAFSLDEASGGTAADRLFGFLDHGIRVARGPLFRQGCLLGSFALNLAETHPELRSKLEDRFATLARSVEPLIRDALREHSGGLPVTAPALARQFVSVIQGSIILAKVADDHRRVAEGLRCYRETLRALLAA